MARGHQLLPGNGQHRRDAFQVRTADTRAGDLHTIEFHAFFFLGVLCESQPGRQREASDRSGNQRVLKRKHEVAYGETALGFHYWILPFMITVWMSA